ncbi:MAG: MFS transporter [Thermaceae bacterium]
MSRLLHGRFVKLLPWKPEGLSTILRLLLALGLMEGARSGFYAGFLPFYAPEYLGLGPATFTLAFTLHQIADISFKSMGGLLAERLGFGRMVALAGILGFFAILATPWAKHGIILWILSAFWGLGFSSLYPGLMTSVSRLASPGREARALSFAFALVMPWVGIGLIGVGQTAQKNPEAALHLLLLAQGLALLMALSLFRYRIPLPPPKREKAYPWGRLLLFLPAAFGQTFAPGLVSLFLLRFAKEELFLEPLALGWLLALGGGTTFLSLPLTGRWVDRKGAFFPLTLGLSTLSLAMFLLAQGVPSFALPLLALLGGLGFALLIPGWNGLLVRTLPEDNRAAIWGSLMSLEGLGVALGPVVGGLLWEVFGIRAPFYAGSLVFSVLALFYLSLGRRSLWKS